MADGTAYYTENAYSAGLLDNSCEKKPAYRELERLINHEWKTEFETQLIPELRFSGFYGNYEITVIADGRKSVHNIRLGKDNTGYDNRLCDFRGTDIIL